jgi:arylsulfatase A-like enzyme
LAELLKPQGYATGQFGKNHLGDKDEMLPTAHGFDGRIFFSQAEIGPRQSDLAETGAEHDGDLTGLRYDNWKFVFLEQRAPGTFQVWAERFTHLRVPLIFNLRLDPYERADITSNTYYDWMIDHSFMLVPAQAYVGRFLATFKDFAPRQKAASFSIDQVLEKLRKPSGD